MFPAILIFLGIRRIQAIPQNDPPGGKMKCPPGIVAFAGYPSTECPTEADYYRCVDGIAVLSQCNSTYSYDPEIDGCGPQKKGNDSDRMLAEDRNIANYRIDVDALGREVHLGNIYYGQNDHIVTDQNLWTEESLKKRKNMAKPYENFDVSISEDILDRMNVFDIDASLKLSFLGGLVSVSGSAHYLDDRRDKKETVTVSLNYFSTNKVESITQEMRLQTNFYDDICKKVGEKDGPTHVVSSITRGFRGILIFKKTVRDFSSVSSVGGSLHVVVKSLPSIQIEADASVNITQDERILVKDLDVSFTGDTILEDSVSTFDDAVRVYKKFGTVAKSSQAVVKFSLSPIENYCKGDLQTILREISGQITKQIFDSVENLDLLSKAVQTLEESDAANAFPETIKKNINLFKKELQKYRNIFAQKLGEILPKVRGQFVGEPSLIAILNNLNDSPFEKGRSEIFLGMLEKEIGTIELFMEKRGDPGSGVVVEEDSSAKGNECRTKFPYQIEFILPVLPDDDHVKQYLENGEFDGEKEPWYDDREQVAKAGHLRRSFFDFFELNKNINKEACFIVGLKEIKGNQKPRITIFGPTGETVTENLKVPLKVIPSGDIHVSFNTIDFKVDYKTDFKLGTVMNYIEINYREYADDSKLPSVHKMVPISSTGMTNIKLDNLKPGSTYEIYLRLVSKLQHRVWAVGPWSDPLTVDTAFSSPPSSPMIKQKDEISASLSWGAPTSTARGITLEYILTAHQDRCTNNVKSTHSTTTTTYTISKLKAATIYCVSLKARAKNHGHSPACYITREDKQLTRFTCVHKSEKELTFITDPPAPTDLIVLAVSQSSVKLQWRGPNLHPTDGLKHYAIEYIKVNTKTKQPLTGSTKTAYTKQTTYTVGALPSGDTFIFRVKVMTIKGSSKLSTETSATTTYHKTELEKFKESLNLDQMDSAMKNMVSKVNNVETSVNTKIRNLENLMQTSVNTKIKNLENFMKSLNTKRVNGNWAAWGSWSCSVANVRIRTRTCTNPVPENGGSACSGSTTDLGSCRNGNWGSWGSWGSCQSSNSKMRRRYCNNPSPYNGGRTCAGSTTTSTASCRNGNWGSWGSWSACTQSSISFKKKGVRSCNNPSPYNGGRACSGGSTTYQTCGTHYGCYIDSSSRILPHSLWTSDTMTPGRCQDHCARWNAPFAGVQAGVQCFCGDHYPSSTKRTSSSQCNTRCKGNSALFCGGGWRMNVYSTPAVGCFVDSPNRVLPYKMWQGAGLTIQRCIAHCSEYKYAGLEVGAYCFCGNSIPTYRRPVGECNFGCNGQKSTRCGGKWRISVFRVRM